jgi:heat shock protein HslJ
MPRLLVLIVLATLALVSACGDASTSDSASPGDTGGDTGGVDLQGTYVTDSVESDTRQLVPGSMVRLTFEGDKIGVDAGCNKMGGTFRVQDGELHVRDLSSTEMGCADALMTQDAWVSEFVTGSPAVSLDGDTLTLASDGVTMRLSTEAATSVPLQNTAWRLDAVVSGGGADGTASSVPAGARHPGIKFTNGIVGWDVSFSTGCNQGHGPVEVGTEVMDFGDLATTKMACPDAVGALETTFLGVLGRGTTYTLEGNRLTLTAADGKSGLVFLAG